MIHRDARFTKAVEDLVTELEARTDAEIVVVAASRSGTYDDVRYAVATAVTFVALAVIVEIPASVPPFWMMVDLLLTWFATAWICNADPILRRMVRARRRLDAVKEAAAAEFHAESVHGTPNRTGLLVYVSALEERVELVPDLGLEARIPKGRWAKALEAFHHADLDHFLTGLREIGDVLEQHVPRVSNSDFDLPNAPRIRT
ncbi:MAG: hypothetical protein H6737_30785 [Alphaproteobacteria bacterium]|nr:hypothetical protein [Alphaproteobacteria bacterium]